MWARDRLLSVIVFGVLMATFDPCVRAGEAPPAPRTWGWRGNWTGLYPAANPPVTWGKIQKGVVSGMTCQAVKPGDMTGSAKPADAPGSAQPTDATGSTGSSDAPGSDGQKLTDAMVRDWLVIGPLEVPDVVQDIEKEQIPGEAALAPAEGDKVGDLAWKRYRMEKKPDHERWGGVELDWVDLTEPLGFKPSSFAYAFSYLHCRRPGKVTFVVDHNYGLKVWVNGAPVYVSAKEAGGYGSHYGISRQKLALVHQHSPKFELTLEKGWNRLLVKVGSPPMALKEWRNQKFAHCVYDTEPVYEEENILWATRLPERTNACPVVVGDRIFTPAEPDELLCLHKATGKILWRRVNGFFDAIPAEERAKSPALRQIEPLSRELAETPEYEKGLELRGKIRDALLGIDKKRFRLKLEGHLEGHFGIVGFTTTPVSDGSHVWAYYGYGVAACYDIDGNRKWIVRLTTEDEVSYSCSPALSGGKLCVIFNGLHALDAETGAVAWSDPKARSIASLLPARIGETDVVTTCRGQVFRASDGKLLWSNPLIVQSDTGWGPGVFLDSSAETSLQRFDSCGRQPASSDQYYLSWIGIGSLIAVDFSSVTGDEWKPKHRVVEVAADHRRPDGEWLDRWTAGSPLILDKTFYGIDQYGIFYAVDLETEKTFFREDTGFDELHTYNAIGVGASAALGGKNIYVVDNQGCCAVYEPGRPPRRLAYNRIETVVVRDWPWPPQEILSNGPLVFDGDRIFQRGEQYLYCIGRR